MHLLTFLPWAAANAAFAASYAIVVERYRSAWASLHEWEAAPHISPSVKISVIIPCRNEAARLPALLASISRQSYPASNFEVILLDDGSEDGGFLLAQKFSKTHAHFRAARLDECQFNGDIFTEKNEIKAAPRSGKKAAIEAGVELASGELIVCTDADCEVPTDWLLLLAAFYEAKKPKFIAAPVNFHREVGSLQRFQSLDFLGMMGVTGAGFQAGTGLLCNGANLAYPKAVFKEVGGFAGIDGMASGDDMLLLHKVAKRYPGQVFYLKNKSATVLTEAQPDLPSFASQRLRWASKSRSYTDWQVTMRLGVVYFLSTAILLNLVFGCAISWPFAVLALGLFLVKTVVDFRFLGGMAKYFGREDLMRGYLLSQLYHIAYIVAIGTAANLVRRYHWKGRNVR